MSGDDQSWWPVGTSDPAFEVRRPKYGAIEGGDYARGGDAALPKTALRYAEPSPDTPAVGQGLLYAHPIDYETVEVLWGFPPDLIWQEMAIVRSVFGAPSTVRDGVTVLRGGWEMLHYDPNINRGLTVYDRFDPVTKGNKVGLTPGNWYYYSLFFKINERDWVRSMTAATLLPRNFQHAEKMWDLIPPYYRWIDDSYDFKVSEGPLRRFVSVFGFEMDLTREYVESWQQVYHSDRSPMRLLRRVGDNLGQPYEEALGDIRFRSFLSRIGSLYAIRGTRRCLEEVVEAASKWDCSTSDSPNLMLLPDDSDFYGYGINASEGDGTGSWGSIHPDTPLDPITTPATNVNIAPPDKVDLYANPSGTVALPDNSGRGSMRMTTPQDEETLPVIITCGCAITTMGREVIPLTNGIPITPQWLYGFSIRIMMEDPSNLTVALLWFGDSGQPSDLVGVNKITPFSPVINDWSDATVQAQAPADARFLVPCVYFVVRDPGGSGTISPFVNFAGAQVYDLGDIHEPVATIGPDRYLTVGDPAEKIGRPPDPNDPAFEGWLMGRPPA